MARPKRFDIEFPLEYVAVSGHVKMDHEDTVLNNSFTDTVKFLRNQASKLKEGHFTVIYLSRRSKEDCS